MADPDVLRSNARAREVAAGLARLATTLIAAIAAKIYFDSDLSLAVLGWIAGAAVLIWLAWLTLSLLESES